MIGEYAHKSGNILDLVCTNFPDKISNIIVSDNNWVGSDHRTINLNLHFENKKERKTQRMVYNFKKANFDGLREHLKYIPFDTSLMDHDININLLQWSDILFQVVDLYIPKIAIRNSQRPSWIDKEVIHLANKKQTAYRKFKRTNSDHHKC